jgi:tetratricopeptide (TPR) repeat protein
MRSGLLLLLFLIALKPMLVGAEASTTQIDLSAMDSLMEKAQYQEALEGLRKALADPTISTEMRSLVLTKLGLFYQHQVGDFDRARRYFNKIGGPKPAGGPPAAMATAMDAAMAAAMAAATELADLEKRYGATDKVLARQKRILLRPGGASSPESRTQVQTAVDRLESIASETPAYYRLHEVYFYIGMGQLALGRNWRSLAAFDKAVVLKPAIHLYQPVRRLSRTARETGWRDLLSTGAWTFTATFGGILVLAALFAKPWQWVSARHLGTGLMVLLLWWGAFQLAFLWIGKHSDAAEIVNHDHFYPAPTYVHTLPDSPGSDLAQLLFRYGSVAVLGIFFLTILTVRLPHRAIILSLNLILAILLSCSLTGIFYLRHCDAKSRLYTHEISLRGLLEGHLAFRLSDPEPYLLTHPTYYRGLELDSIYDPELLEWIKKYQ